MTIPPVRAHTLLAYTPFPFTAMSVRILFLKEGMADVFCNFLSKTHKQDYQIKKVLYKAI